MGEGQEAALKCAGDGEMMKLCNDEIVKFGKKFGKAIDKLYPFGIQ